MTYCKRGTKGYLYLEDGTLIEGCGFGARAVRAGEVVFTTAMNGYPESLTDPSYRGQILVITHPLVGNYGVPKKEAVEGILTNFESEKIQVAGLVVAEETEPYKWNSVMSLHEWLHSEGVPGLSDVDTRAIVKRVRTKGAMMGVISSGYEFEDPRKFLEKRYDEIDFTEFTSPKEVIVHRNRSDKVIVVVDCGIKHGILHSLYQKLGYTIVRVPCKTSADKVMEHEPVGVVFSNGPGNPNLLKEPVETYRALVEYGVPILGICLGHQIGTIALGGRIRKMKFGHRAVNKPVVDVTNNSCYISTHNHGYAILDKADMPHGAKLWFVNPDDGTIEGWYHERYKILSVQFHPEARPGPWDTTWVFDRFGKLISP